MRVWRVTPCHLCPWSPGLRRGRARMRSSFCFTSGVLGARAGADCGRVGLRSDTGSGRAAMSRQSVGCMSPLAKTLWLDKVREARPVFSPGSNLFATLPYRLGVIVLAFCLSVSGLAWQGCACQPSILWVAGGRVFDDRLSIAFLRVWSFVRHVPVGPLGGGQLD